MGEADAEKVACHPKEADTRGIAPPRPWRNPAAACVSGAVCILRITASFSERNNSGSTSAGAPSEPSSSPTTSAVQKMDKIRSTHDRERDLVSSLVASCKKTPWRRRRRLECLPLLSGDRPRGSSGQTVRSSVSIQAHNTSTGRCTRSGGKELLPREKSACSREPFDAREDREGGRACAGPL